MAKQEDRRPDDDQTVVGHDAPDSHLSGSGALTNVSGRNVPVDAMASLADSLLSSGPASALPSESLDATELPAAGQGSGIDEAASSQLFGDAPLASLADSVLSGTDQVAFTPLSGVGSSVAGASAPGAFDLDSSSLGASGSGVSGPGSSVVTSAVEPAAAAPAAKGKKAAKEKKPAKEKKGGAFIAKLTPYQKYLEWGGLALLLIILLALGFFKIILIATAVYLFSLAAVAYGVWLGRRTNTVYSVILGCALAAVITATFCLWLEWARYGLDIKARGARSRVGAVLHQPSSPAVKTTAAA